MTAPADGVGNPDVIPRWYWVTVVVVSGAPALVVVTAGIVRSVLG